MKLIGATVAGVIAGAIGAAIWAAIAYFAHVEVGWIAWGIGLVVGVAVRAVAAEETGFLPGAAAVIIALASVVGGKYATISLMMRDVNLNFGDVTQTQMIESLAFDIVDEKEKAGEKLAWPAGKNAENAESEADLPPEIRKVAKERWNALGQAEQNRQIAERKAFMEQAVGALRNEAQMAGFKESFSGFDLLWFGLAAMTAYRIGSGVDSSEATA